MRVIVIAAGDLGDPCFFVDFFEPADYIIAANGGSANTAKLGLSPDLLIGDLDSLEPGTREQVLTQSRALEEHPPEKEKSDLELALDRAIAMAPREIIILGALGGERVDHGFINILLLTRALTAAIPARIVGPGVEVCLVGPGGSLVIEGRAGEQVSLFALGEKAGKVKTAGLKYPLDSEELCFASTRGLSNEMLTSRARVSVGCGLLAVFKSHHR